MCGPFTRDLRHAPAGLIEHIKALQRQQQLQNDGYCAPFDDGLAFQQQQPAVLKKADYEPVVPEAPDAGLFNWTLLDEASIPDIDTTAPVFSEPEVLIAPVPEAPVFFSAPEDFIADPVVQQCGWTSMGSTGTVETGLAPAPFGAMVAPSFPDQWNTTESAVPQQTGFVGTAALKHEEPHSEMSDHDSHMCHDSGHSTEGGHSTGDESKRERKPCRTKAKASVEQLPKALANHPCAATLLSAGIRIKGRNEEELLQVAERIKKRRRASAARCRARRANHIHDLEDENQELKEENALLRKRIAELTGGNLEMNAMLDAELADLTHLECA